MRPFRHALAQRRCAPQPPGLDIPALGRNPRTVVLLFTLAARRQLRGHGCYTVLPVPSLGHRAVRLDAELRSGTRPFGFARYDHIRFKRILIALPVVPAEG